MPTKTTDKIISLSSPITDIKGIGPKKAENIYRLGVKTLGESLDLYPRSYEDFRNVKAIAQIQNEDKCLVRGVVIMARFGKGFGRKRTLHVLVEDKTGRMEVLFFMAGFM